MTRRRPTTHALSTLAALALTAACHGTAPTTAPAADAAAPAADSSPFAALNLGFEQADTPAGWNTARSDYAVSIDDATAFEGGRSLSLVHDGEHRSGRVNLEIPAELVRGKTLRAQVHVRTAGVDRGGVSMWLHVARGDDGLDRATLPHAERVHGDHDWTPIAVEVPVPAEADTVKLVLDHAGSGTAWFDGVELSLSPLDAPPPPATLHGVVHDEAGKPAPQALVAVFAQSGEHAVVKTDGQGRFSLDLAPGQYALGVSGAGGVGNASGLTLTPGDNDPVEVTLAAGVQQLHGTLRDQDGRPYADALTVVATADERVFPTRTDADGRWSLSVPAAAQYMAVFQGASGQRAMAMVEDPKAEITATLAREGAAPAAAIEWIRDHHVPLRTVEPGSGIDDLAALDPMFAEATVVGLGEATHGTREFFQLKHRMLEYLVERHGFTVFGIEANRTECRAIDRYVQTGEGDPKDALAGIYFWTWDTQEVLALIEWMRQYNATHEKKLHFVGFDAQMPEVAARSVEAFLDRVEAKAPGRDAVAVFSNPWNREALPEMTSAERDALAPALDKLAQRFEQQRDAWIAATSADDYADAREDLTVVQQVLRQRTVPMMESFAARDRAMADNVLHIEKRYGKGTKAVLWAHNGHVARSWSQTDVMGKYIGQTLGDRYVSVGFAFDRGGFQALSMKGGQMVALREHVVGSSPEGEIEAALREGGPELFMLNLRDLPRKGDAAKWLRSPLPMRQIGAGFGVDDMSARVIEPVPERYDALLFVEQTTRARPVDRD